MNIAIVGAAGFIGSALSRVLIENGQRVFGFDIGDPVVPLPFARWQRVDVGREAPALEQPTDAVFYLAQSPHYHEFPRHAEALFGVAGVGLARTAAAAAACGCRFFCFASTGTVYRPAFQPLSEDWPVRADDPYALSKVQAEQILGLYARHMTTLSARFFGVFGPGQRAMLPAKLRDKIRQGEAITLDPRPGETGATEGLTMSFTFLDDLVRCLIALMELARGGTALPAVLNVAGPEAISLERFASTLARCIGMPARFRRTTMPRECDWVADISRLRRLLQPSFTDFQTAMARSYAP